MTPGVRHLLLLLAGTLALGCGGDAQNDPRPTDTQLPAEDAGDTDVADASDDSDAAPPPDTSAPDVEDVTPTPDAGEGGWPPPYPAANVLPPEDPRYEGQAMFLYSTWGTEVLDQYPPADFLVGLMTSEPEVFGNQFSRFGFLPDPNRDLPVGLVRGQQDPARVHETCAQCHVGTLPDGRIWLGAPATTLDLNAFRIAVNQRWVAAGNPPFWSERQLQKLAAYGPGRTAADSDSYPTPVPADFPPYYRLGERTALNYLGTGRNLRTEAYFSIFSFGAGSPNDDEAIVPFPSEDETAPFLAYLGTIDAPQPPAQDPVAVARGAQVFVEARCNSCHFVEEIGRNGVTPVDTAPDGLERFPGDDPAWPRGSIRTSLAHRVLVDGDENTQGDDGRADLVRFLLTRRLSVFQSDGYRVHPLQGLWTSAPYLHNGSVPTLDDLLRPAAERPVTFLRGDFEVDTRLPYNSNRGHEFGVNLEAADRNALVAYLLSL